MKRLMLVLLASAALSAPVYATQTQQTSPAPKQVTSQTSSGQTMAATSSSQSTMTPAPSASSGQPGYQVSANEVPIPPRSLSRWQIRRVQEALNDRGFNSGEADGIWGDETRQALVNFQKAQNFRPDGQLDQMNLDALGLKSLDVASNEATENSSSEVQ